MPYNNCELAICKFRNGAKWQGAKCVAFICVTLPLLTSLTCLTNVASRTLTSTGSLAFTSILALRRTYCWKKYESHIKMGYPKDTKSPSGRFKYNILPKTLFKLPTVCYHYHCWMFGTVLLECLTCSTARIVVARITCTRKSVSLIWTDSMNTWVWRALIDIWNQSYKMVIIESFSNIGLFCV